MQIFIKCVVVSNLIKFCSSPSSTNKLSQTKGMQLLRRVSRVNSDNPESDSGYAVTTQSQPGKQ